MFDVIFWVFSFWSVWIWVIPLIIVAGVLYRLFGWRFATPVLSLAGIIGIFLLGRKIERDNFKKNVEDIQRKRNIEYAKIDARRTGVDDVADRLRDGKF
ncbi:hypothetical protein [Mesorhizobium sp. CN2-181]|uniref:hypothetical protein n=1 Tax=Mesorhizobium yinganensis TaxID=3157707 RepID=UPI0032B73877